MKYFYYIIPCKTAICLLSRGGSCRVIGSWSLLLSFTLHSCIYLSKPTCRRRINIQAKNLGLTFTSVTPIDQRGQQHSCSVSLTLFSLLLDADSTGKVLSFHTVIKSVLCLSPQMNVWETWPLWPVMQRTWSEFCPRWRRLSGPRGPTHPLRGLASLPSLLIHRSSSANGQHRIYNW